MKLAQETTAFIKKMLKSVFCIPKFLRGPQIQTSKDMEKITRKAESQ